MTPERNVFEMTRHEWRAYKQRLIRRRRVEQGICLNAETHGPATHGVLCAKCRETHRRSA